MDILALSKINALKKSGGVGFDETKTSTYTFTKFGVCIGDDEYRYTKVSEEPVDLKTISKMTIFDPAYENVAGVPYAEHTSFTYVSEDGVDCLLDSIGAFIFAYSFPQALDDIEKGFYIVSSMNENLFEKVVLECETIHTIDPKYLPSGGSSISSYTLETVVTNPTMQPLYEVDSLFLTEQAKKKQGLILNFYIENDTAKEYYSVFAVYTEAEIKASGDVNKAFAFEMSGMRLMFGYTGDSWILVSETA